MTPADPNKRRARKTGSPVNHISPDDEIGFDPRDLEFGNPPRSRIERHSIPADEMDWPEMPELGNIVKSFPSVADAIGWFLIAVGAVTVFAIPTGTFAPAPAWLMIGLAASLCLGGYLWLFAAGIASYVIGRIELFEGER